MYILLFLNSHILVLPILYYLHQVWVAMVTVAMGIHCFVAGSIPPEGGSAAPFGLDQPHSKYQNSEIVESNDYL